MAYLNVFRVLADLSHTLSKCILIWAIHSNKSAEGVSLITQVLYAAVFTTRYEDLFWTTLHSTLLSWWNFLLKIFYILTSFYIIFIMMKVYARTREREKAWKLGAFCLGGSIVFAPILALIRHGKNIGFFDTLWTFSIVLESVCVIPQLLLLRQTTVPTVIDSGYILTLGSYRALYILNWILRLAHKDERNPDWRAVLFGVLQTAFYIDFAWVYWTRQRVKLRNGGVVDSDDLSRGFLVGKFFGKGAVGTDEEQGPLTDPVGGGDGNASNRWGARGISVSADDDIILPPGQRDTTRDLTDDVDDDLEEFMDDERRAHENANAGDQRD